MKCTRAMLVGLMLFILLLAAGCSSEGNEDPEISPAPALSVLQVAVPPALRPAVPALQACNRALADIAVLPVEITEDQASQPDYALVLSLGSAPAASTFSAALAQENILVVVNEANPAGAVLAEDVADIYQGKKQLWEQGSGEDDGTGTPVEPWAYTRSSSLRGLFESGLGRTEDFSAGLVFLAPDPEAMVEAVESSAAAIGYLPAAWGTGSLVPLQLEPEPETAWTFPVLASTLEPLNESTRALIACLQSGPGQDTLLQVYSFWGEGSP